MAYNDKFRLSSHAVITNKNDEILLVKANYGERVLGCLAEHLSWGKLYIKR